MWESLQRFNAMKWKDATFVEYIHKEAEAAHYYCCLNFGWTVSPAFPRDASEVVLWSYLPTHNAARSLWRKYMRVNVFSVLETWGWTLKQLACALNLPHCALLQDGMREADVWALGLGSGEPSATTIPAPGSSGCSAIPNTQPPSKSTENICIKR